MGEMKIESVKGKNKGRTRGLGAGSIGRQLGSQKSRGGRGKMRVGMLKIIGKPKTKGHEILRILAMSKIIANIIIANTFTLKKN